MPRVSKRKKICKDASTVASRRRRSRESDFSASNIVVSQSADRTASSPGSIPSISRDQPASSDDYFETIRSEFNDIPKAQSD